MQGLLEPPRQGFQTADVLQALGWSPDVSYDMGYELLDGNDNPVLDLSDQMVKTGSQAMRDCNADIQGSCSLVTRWAHNWGVDRVRPYYLIGCSKVPRGPIRFDVGVFILTTPGQPLGQAEPLYQATGQDKNYLLSNPIGDAYTIASGANYFTEIRAAIAAGGGGTHVTLDGSKSTATLPGPLNWSIQDAATTTWLQVVNELLKAIAYRPLWVDQNGYYRSEPAVDPVNRAVEFILGAGDAAIARYLDPKWPLHTVVDPDNRSINRDSWNHPNWWRFIQQGLTFQPIEGSGQYTVQNLSSGPTSQAGVGRVVKAPPVFLNASGQADLQAQGDLIVARSVASAETLVFNTAPLPLAGHFDMLIYADPTLPGQDQRKVVAQSWIMPFDGKNMSWVTQVAQSVDSGLWTAGGTTANSPSFNPPNMGHITYPTPTPPSKLTH